MSYNTPPSRFKMPQLDPYDGTIDLLDHSESYKGLMQIQNATDYYFASPS